jgi:hypothetical protein
MFKNAQWRVTPYGLEAVRPAARFDYAIEAARLSEPDGEGHYAWPAHMARKGWVDVEAFIAAYLHALETHKGAYAPPIDLARLERTLTRARAIAVRAAAA